MPELTARYSALFRAVEMISIAVFTVEYLLRLWAAVEHAPYSHLAGQRARIRYALSPAGIIDLLAVLPFWIALLFPVDLRILLVFRTVRFLKLARYSPAMRSLLDVLARERRALFGCFVILIGAMLVAASIMYLVEREAQPDKFGTIPDAMWWAIVTLGTVGYGDVVPITPLGRVVATFTIFSGIIMLALPVGIIATAFANEIHRRDFVVTWGMVARVPLFAELEAGDIADIMRLLRAQTVEPGGVVVRRGEPGHSMYFIAAGEVEIDLKPNPARRRPVLRRDRGAAAGAAHRDGQGDQPHEPLGAGRARPARAPGALTQRSPSGSSRDQAARRQTSRQAISCARNWPKPRSRTESRAQRVRASASQPRG